MLPYFHFFGLTFPAYGIMLALGFLTAAFFGAYRVKKAGLCTEDYILIAAIGFKVIGYYRKGGDRA